MSESNTLGASPCNRCGHWFKEDILHPGFPESHKCEPFQTDECCIVDEKQHEQQPQIPTALVELMFDCAKRACADILFEVCVELDKWGDPVVGKIKESLIQAIRNRVLGPGFLSGIGSNLPK